ncbi:unnamed protein product [Diatraea saccharalis]|uniref:Poly(A) polymerase nucleotidyltransferase domain-containing protein n=1 Tax=Diatraea saccharalis TaxID=40085 RepID=A0A9N9WDA4_9NEOP|nr:unnamed protein product [Diatraea saccharalis]
MWAMLKSSRPSARPTGKQNGHQNIHNLKTLGASSTTTGPTTFINIEGTKKHFVPYEPTNKEKSDKTLGMTSAISLAGPTQFDIEKTKSLKEYLIPLDAFEPEAEMQHRMEVLSSVYRLVRQWICDKSFSKNVPASVVDTVGGKLYTFGSYRLGVRNKSADIDALCVAPRHIQRSDFFTSFYDFSNTSTPTEFLYHNRLFSKFSKNGTRHGKLCAIYKMGFSQTILMVKGTLPSKFDCQRDRKKRQSDTTLSRTAYIKRVKTAQETEAIADMPGNSTQKDDSNIPETAMEILGI